MDKLNKLDEDIDEIKKNVTDLCIRTSVMESDYKNHVDIQISSADKKYKMIAVIFGCVSAIATISNFLK